MKRFLSLSLALIMSLSFVACDSGETTTTQGSEETEQQQEEQQSEESTTTEEATTTTTTVEETTTTTTEEEKKAPITLEELEFNLETDQAADSLGQYYSRLSFTNNSDYPITMFSMDAILKDSNEKTYYGGMDTVLPGETSANMLGSGPATGNKDDIQILSMSIMFNDEDGNEHMLSYDFKLDQYKILY